MPRGKKKIEEEEFVGEPVGEPGEDDLPPMPLPTEKKQKEVKEDSVEELRKKLQEAEAEEVKKNFVATAPKRLEELEKVVKDNRSYIINLSNQLRELQDNLNLLIKK